jgi:hypothetical protein
MAYTNAEGRRQLLDELGAAADRIGVALGALGEAYEQLDEYAGDRLEEALFRPVQHAYGRARRTHTEFSERHGFPARTFSATEVHGAARAAGAKAQVQTAVDALRQADGALAELQDSMLPVEVGDAEVRAGIAEVRELIGPLPGRARELVRSVGR